MSRLSGLVMYDARVLRAFLIAATFCAAGCPTHAERPGPNGPNADDTAVRITIARAEVKRAGGITELSRLANDSNVHTRELALRGLGRIGGDEAIRALLAATNDPLVAPAAYAAIGVAASLDDTAPLAHHPIDLARYASREAVAIVEAFGRAAGVDDQPAILAAITGRSPEVIAAGALAFGRMARRKLAFSPAALDFLVQASAHADREVRYAATYSLAREYKPADASAARTLAALIARLVDEDPETRAAALGGLAKRGVQPNSTNGALEDSLRDTDWRVAVEAVRALAGDKGTDAGREFVATNLARRWARLATHPDEAQVLVTSLQLLLAHPTNSPTLIAALKELVALGGSGPKPIALLARLALATQTHSATAEQFVIDGLAEHVGFAITTDAFAALPGPEKQKLLRRMTESKDPRERATGLGLLVDTPADVIAPEQITAQLAAAVAAKDPVISGAGADAIAGWLESHGAEPTLVTALVARASTEDEPELASGLLDTIGKYKLAAGVAACRRGLTRHPIVAHAAVECLKNLGEAVPAPAIGDGEVPPVDPASVIGKTILWHLATTRGAITIQLRPDISPWAAATVVALTRKHFYDGLEFHRVVADFVVQGGDPTMSGVGGPGFSTPAEPATSLDASGFVTGGIGIADAGRDSGGSQWFAMHSRAPHLDGRYTYIGAITDGQNIANSLLVGDAVQTATVEIRN